MAYWSAIGAVAGAAINSASASSANAANASLNERNIQWQTDMSNTAMQRRVRDLKAAGLNPLLAVGGPGASQPSASMIPMQPTTRIDPATAAQVANLAADTRLKEANAESVRANTPVGLNEAPKTTAQALQQANNETAWKQLHIKDQELQQAITQTNIIAENYKQAVAQTATAQATADQAEAQAKLKTASLELANILAKSEIPEAQANAKLWQDIGESGRVGNWIANGLQALISLLHGAKALTK